MKKFTRLLLILFVVLIGMYFLLQGKPYISKSKIHGSGLFAGKDYKKGDLIFEDLFPYSEKNEILFNPIGKEKFNRYLLEEGKYINHCSRNKNMDIVTKDYISFSAVASRDINKREEIYADYDTLHKHHPFIAPSLPSFMKC